MSYGRPGNNQAYYGGAPPTRQQQFGLPPPQPQTFGGPPQFQDGYSQGPPQDGFSSQGFPLQPQLGFGGPPAGQFPPQQQYGAQPTPSPGYDPRATAMGDASADAHVLRGAMKGFGTDEATLIRVLSKPDPLQMALLRNTYAQQIGRNLEKDVASETSSYFKEGLLALVRGPLMQDVHNVHKAIKGAGTKESVLNDVLLGRSNADMRAIKQAYQTEYKRMMEADVKADLSMKTERLFGLVMQATRAEETMPVNPQDIDRDVTELHRATEGRTGADQIMVCSILSQRSDGQIRFIARDYQQRYGVGFEKVIKKEFSGHMEDALLLMFGRATDRAMTDAVQIEDSMKGIGTKDDLLVNRIMRMHWDRMGMDQVKRAYAHRYKTDLIERVKGEVRGDVEKLLVACLT